MKRIIGLIVAASLACGIEYDGLRVKFGWTDALADIEYFYHIPRTIKDAEAEGWKRTQRQDSFMQELRLYCLINKSVCGLYDVGGFVAGLQVALPADEFESLAINPDMKMLKWKPQPFEEERTRVVKEYWMLGQYFVSSESLKVGAGPRKENGATLQDGGVWLPGPDGRLLRVPTTEAELNTTIFKKQNCIPNMGIHYYYNMTPEMKCEKVFPWFALVTQGELVGTGFQMFGKLTAKQKFREWFENTPSPKQSAQITIPNAPQCLYDWADTYGVISLHIYYIDKPWTIRCMKGDSIKQPPVFDRLLLNGYRYATQVTDEFRKLFIG